MFSLVKNCVGLAGVFLFSGCYTLKQGVGQVKLLAKRTNISEVIEKKLETKERLEKLRLVPQIVEFAKNKLLLTPGKSYTSYIRLQEPSISWIVQAADQKELRLKTWWFPIVGDQPYLGFFDKNDALEVARKLKEEGFDISVGSVQAFSLLGYFPDPVYSSMLDGNDNFELVETLIHEITHSTIYLPNYSSFNENLANFVGRTGAREFFIDHPDSKVNIREYDFAEAKNAQAQKSFLEYLLKVRENLNEFYKSNKAVDFYKDKEIFSMEREKIFDNIAKDYQLHMKGLVSGTPWQYYFLQGRINNAVIMGYSLYESKQEPFEKLYKKTGNKISSFMQAVQKCVSTSFENEEQLWKKIDECS